MKRKDTLALVASMVVSAGLMGWIVWSQRPAETPVAAAAAPSTESATTPPTPELPSLDAARVAELQATADQDPANVQARVDLGTLFLEAQRFEEAVSWFEAALALEPDDVDRSTDLGVAYYYGGDLDQALEQFDRSLEIEPAHAETLLHVGVVRAFGKQDLEGAIAAWEEVQRVVPGSLEAMAAADAIERLRSAHP
ncbi:MAG: tetratricopeptide repeat protein [Acidobacteriota bacterium]|nr:tetratricopeptide repeat protein [Acidobacteriota bacterium]